MKKLGVYQGRTVNVIIDGINKTDTYEIIDNGEHKIVARNEIKLTDKNTITLDELGGIMGIKVIHL